jgi:hypothetical protein
LGIFLMLRRRLLVPKAKRSTPYPQGIPLFSA